MMIKFSEKFITSLPENTFFMYGATDGEYYYKINHFSKEHALYYFNKGIKATKKEVDSLINQFKKHKCKFFHIEYDGVVYGCHIHKDIPFSIVGDDSDENLSSIYYGESSTFLEVSSKEIYRKLTLQDNINNF